MELLKRNILLILCVIIAIMFAVIIKISITENSDVDALNKELKSSKEREALYREEVKQLRIDRSKDLKKIDSLKADKIDLLREIQNIRNDEKDKLDKVDAYTTGELQQFFTDRYGK